MKMEWQPIETAPKDGSEVWLWEQARSKPYMGYYNVSEHYRHGKLEYRDEGWRICGMVILPNEVDPTHWLSVPDPPVGFV